ncbi:MAG: hypothetical protein ACLUFT_09955 [Gemmiger formicilis]
MLEDKELSTVQIEDSKLLCDKTKTHKTNAIAQDNNLVARRRMRC